MTQREIIRLLAEQMAARLGRTRVSREELRRRLRPAVRLAMREIDPAVREDIIALVEYVLAQGGTPPEGSLDPLFRQLALVALVRWLRLNRPAGEPPPGPRARAWLARVSDDHPLLPSAIRVLVSVGNAADRARIKRSFQKFVAEEETKMLTFIFDRRGLPVGFNQQQFEDAVIAFFESHFKLTASDYRNVVAVIIGTLLINEVFDINSKAFQDHIKKAWNASIEDTVLSDGITTAPISAIYDKVVEILVAIPGHGSTIAYQEVAAVSRYAADNAEQVPLDSPYFPSQVRIALDRYVAGTPAEETLTLPPLSGDQGQDAGLDADGIRAVGTVAACFHLDRNALVIRVVDRIVELFNNSLLPIPYGADARLLDTYYFNAEDRFRENERLSIFGRVIGAPNAEVSKEVQPNTGYQEALRRFIASLAEDDRQRTVADIFETRGRRPFAMTGEQVRTAGNRMACNASLYGWAGTQTQARRLKDHIEQALAILRLPAVQQTWGVTSPFAVVERVAQSEFGHSPNLVKYRTMAEAEMNILHLVAKHLAAWTSTSGRPLFEPPLNGGGDAASVSDIPLADEQTLKLHAQNWLAVQGIGDEQVDTLSQPADTAYMPSIPTMGGNNGKAAGGTDMVDKLKAMISSGTTPTLDQLQQLLPGMR